MNVPANAKDLPQIKSCGVLVFRDQSEHSFLLMEHADRLDIPKGHVEPGETDHQCALRELEEETGIRVDNLELDPDFRFTMQYYVRPRELNQSMAQKTLVVFLGQLVEETPILVTEHISFRWVTWDPPHQIQTQTIDPLLASVANYWKK